MIMNESVNFEKHTKETYTWLDDIARKAGTPNRMDWAYHALRSVLHTIRDRTTLQEAFHLSAQLPLFIRGVYFESYKSADKPDKLNVKEFLDRIGKNMGPENRVKPEDTFRAVLEVLYKHVSPGQLSDIRGTMSKDIQRMWDHNLANNKPASYM